MILIFSLIMLMLLYMNATCVAVWLHPLHNDLSYDIEQCRVLAKRNLGPSNSPHREEDIKALVWAYTPRRAAQFKRYNAYAVTS